MALSSRRLLAGGRASRRFRDAAFAVMFAAAAAGGQPADPGAAGAKPQAAPSKSGGGSELMLFDEMPTVVSATRQEQPINLSPVPVSIITKETIHFSGLTNLPEILQFSPGIDSVRLDRNNYAVGVRGFHHTFSDRTLLLIDGRNANSSFVGSIDLLTLPLQMEDIERVEIVRGPGGAAWGANAFNGVINIITKEPGAEPGVLISSTLSQYGDTYNQFAWSGTRGDLAWRLSGGYEQRETSEKAVGDGSFTSRDFAREYRFRALGTYKISDSAKLKFGLSQVHAEEGDYGFAQYWAMRDQRIDLTRAFARLESATDAGSDWYVQLYHNFESSDEPQLSSNLNFETDLDAQINFHPTDTHRFTAGGNVRWTHADPSLHDPQQFTYPMDSYDEYWAGIFGMDRWSVSDRVTIESQLRADYYSGTSSDWSGRLTGLYAVDAAKRQTLRVSAAKAFRAPLPGLRDATTHRFLLPSPPYTPDTFGVNVVPAPGVDNEEIYSLEAGYYAQITDELTARADVYEQWYNRLVGVTQPDRSVPLYMLNNNGGAEAPGAELELSYKRERFNGSVWYAHNGFNLDSPKADIRAFEPAINKAGATARFAVTERLTAAGAYRWSDRTLATVNSGSTVRPYNVLDLSATLALADGRLELLAGVSDVFDQSGRAISGVGAFMQHETPGRTFFFRVQGRF